MVKGGIPRKKEPPIFRREAKGALNRVPLHRYDHGLAQGKLNNLYIGQKEGWRLQDQNGKDLGALTVAVNSNMSKDGKVGPFTPWQHLLREAYVQRHSYLQEHQRLPPGDAKEVFENPNEKYHTHVVAEVDGKGAAFAVVDRAKFSDGESYVKMFYIPTVLTSEKRNFTNSFVVAPNSRREPLEQLIWRLSLEHVDGENMLTVFDAPEAELPQLTKYKFRALAPKFDVPSVKAKTSREFGQVADQVCMVIRPPARTKRYEHGVDLEKAFELFTGYMREGYYLRKGDIDEFAKVRSNEESRSKRIMNAMHMYNDGIRRLVDSAVKVDGKVIVPYKGVQIKGAVSLDPNEKKGYRDRYLNLGEAVFEKYKRHFPKGRG